MEKSIDKCKSFKVQPVHKEESLSQDVSIHASTTELSDTPTGEQGRQEALNAARWASDSIMVCRADEMLKQEINRLRHSKTSSINEPVEFEKEREVKETQHGLRTFSFNTNYKLNNSQTSERECEANSNGQGCLINDTNEGDLRNAVPNHTWLADSSNQSGTPMDQSNCLF
ncbi:unnamed protein product [Hymenolepis diminuta]|uniref:Uncharacterized protein n=1 Tax=Hymenolepis diminuta TaxID=6216 RepID=A0A0R3SGQ9_HYMDI|nr:unnamed protein product [Hymenolepis diminuta]VUZ51691.1 unnamed protein product [Hymenolepis diminuta]